MNWTRNFLGGYKANRKVIHYIFYFCCNFNFACISFGVSLIFKTAVCCWLISPADVSVCGGLRQYAHCLRCLPSSSRLHLMLVFVVLSLVEEVSTFWAASSLTVIFITPLWGFVFVYTTLLVLSYYSITTHLTRCCWPNYN